MPSIDPRAPALDESPNAVMQRIRESRVQKIEQPGSLRSLGDTGVAIGRGVVTGFKSLTDLAGAGNAASRGLSSIAEGIGSLESDYRKAERVSDAVRIKEAEQSGNTGREIGAYLKSFANAPVDTSIEALGASVPTLAAAALTRGRVNPTLVGAGVGAAQGVGEVKGNIFDAVSKRAIAEGKTAEEADTLARAAQSYRGENADQLALGGLLGAVAGSSGAEKAVARIAAGRAAAEGGVLKRAAVGAVGEALPEAAQGGQGQYAANLAQQRAGFEQNLAEGVAGQAVIGAVASAPLGAAFNLPGAPAVRVDPGAGAISRALSQHADAQPDADGTAAVPAPYPPQQSPSQSTQSNTDPATWFSGLDEAGRRDLIRTASPELRSDVVGLMATARNPESPEFIRQSAAARLFEMQQNLSDPPDAVAEPALDTPGGNLLAQKETRALPSPVAMLDTWLQRAEVSSLDRAQDVADASAARGLDAVVLPARGGTGYVVAPRSLLSGDAVAAVAGIQRGGALPGPNDVVGKRWIAGTEPGAVRAETRADVQEREARVQQADAQAAALQARFEAFGKQTARGENPIAGGAKGVQAFATRELASTRAATLTQKTGVAHVVTYHPIKDNKFAAIPDPLRSVGAVQPYLEGSNDETQTTGGQEADAGVLSVGTPEQQAPALASEGGSSTRDLGVEGVSADVDQRGAIGSVGNAAARTSRGSEPDLAAGTAAIGAGLAAVTGQESAPVAPAKLSGVPDAAPQPMQPVPKTGKNEPVRPLVEALIKRRAAANQVGLSRRLNTAIEKAKAELDGTGGGKAGYFRMIAKDFEKKGDPDTAKTLMALHDAIQAGKKKPDAAGPTNSDNTPRVDEGSATAAVTVTVTEPAPDLLPDNAAGSGATRAGKGAPWDGKSSYGDKTDTQMRAGDTGAGKTRPYASRAAAVGRVFKDSSSDTHEVVQVGKSAFVVRPVQPVVGTAAPAVETPGSSVQDVQAEAFDAVAGDARVQDAVTRGDSTAIYQAVIEWAKKTAASASAVGEDVRATVAEALANGSDDVTALAEAIQADAKTSVPRVNKLQNTGADLRRWFDKQKQDIRSGDSTEAVLAALEKATTRAELFRNVLATDATPGAGRALDSIRTSVMPFKQWLTERGSLQKLSGHYRAGSRYADSPALRLPYYIDGKDDILGAGDESREARIERLRDAAQSYVDQMLRVVDVFRGAGSVEALARAVNDSLIREGAALGIFRIEESSLTDEGRVFLALSGKPDYVLRYLRWDDAESSRSNSLLRLMQSEQTTAEATRKAPLKRNRLEKVERRGKDWRKGDVTPDQMKRTFEFADIGFGRWVAAKRDQAHLNYAFDAFRDMAELLGLPPAAISLGGRLHFTIGALGHGRHAAHYQKEQPHPDGGTVPVINVTNTQGDGTVAHEWGHALDLTPDAISNEAKRAIHTIRGELKRTYDMDQLRKKLSGFLDGTTWWRGDAASSKTDAGRIANAAYAIDRYKNQTSQFLQNAQKLDGSNKKEPYWSNDAEIFARAWEAWVSDRVENSGVNSYLVDASWVGDGAIAPPTHRGQPYPAGDERVRFNAMFDALAKSLRYDAAAKQIVLDSKMWEQERPKTHQEWADAIAALKAELPDMLEERKTTLRLAADARESAIAEAKSMRVGDVVEARGDAGEAFVDWKTPVTEVSEGARGPVITLEGRDGTKRVFSASAFRVVERALDAPRKVSGSLSDDDLSRLFDEAAAELAEAKQEQPNAPTPGAKILKPAATQPKPATVAATDPEADKTAGKIAAEAAKQGVKGIDEAMAGLVKLFGGGKGKLMSFPGGIDEDTYKAALPHFKASLSAFQNAGKSIKDLFKFLIEQFGGGIKPYAIRFAKESDLTENLGAKPSAARQIADFVESKLGSSEKISTPALFDTANKAFGGKQSEGVYSPKDAYDAMEAGMNLHLVGLGLKADEKSVQEAEARITQLGNLTALLPTQTRRDAEMDEYQQFSTPPALAYAASWVGNISDSDTVLEPSAGTGDLVVYAHNAGAQIVVNELSSRRAEILRAIFPSARVFTENAEQLNNVLPGDVQPTLVLMNPPFSSTAGRIPGERKTSNGGRHVEQALKRLAPGGRLVAIVGNGMADGKPAFRDWWSKIRSEYRVRANIGVDGREYAKYGTTFDNQILVIDKTGATTGDVVTGNVTRVADLPALLESIRNDRPETTAARHPATEFNTPAVPGSANLAETNRLGRGDQRAGTRVADPVGGDGKADAGQSASGGRVVPGGQRGRVRDADGAGTDASTNAGRADNRPGRRRADRVDAGGSTDTTGSSGNAVGVSDDAGSGAIEIEAAESVGKSNKPLTESVFEAYTPQKLRVKGALPHIGALVQSSAMASVEPPTPTYTPNLPADVIHGGKLSLAQIEAVVYAGQAHEAFLPNGERRGFFIGDGTGVGKGREIAGILLDNLRQGRKKALWVSFNQGLMNDAKRDLGGVGGDPGSVFNAGKTRANDAIKADAGIAFTTYSTLGNGAEADKGGGKKARRSRLDQLVEWLGEDFDGVIAFDEAHQMGNAVAIKGKRGSLKPSKRALAGIELQNRLPKARVIYVSATGATEISNLAFASRLGLWGEATPFASVQVFVNQVSNAGVAGMELIARDMKALGLYIARSLAYTGVGYRRLEHPLTPLQTDIYNELADAWQGVLQNIDAALEMTNQDKSADAKGAALAKFWGSHQRFFNQIITTMQVPSMIEDAKRRIADGSSVVIQLVNTNEADQKRQSAKAADEDTPPEELDFTPRQGLMDYVRSSFPTAVYHKAEDANGNVKYEQVFDSSGAAVINKDAEALRDALLAKLETIRVPENPLDAIINAFGPDTVAEITGRKARFITTLDENGDARVTEQKRGSTASKADADAFQADEKSVLIFSQAGGTGYSFHADNTAKNQRKRVHYLLQPGWRADSAVQGFGRTHRTNQKQPPEYVLLATDLKAQKRFVSSIARRLDQLGALTKGQRNTASQGLFTATDNLESKYAEDAVEVLFRDMYAGRTPLDFTDTTRKMGLDLRDKTGALSQDKIPEVRQFLNRLLSLRTEDQGAVFDEFERRLVEGVEYAKQRGVFDDGMQTLKAASAVKVRDEVVHTDARTGATTRFVEVEVSNPVRYQTFDQVRAWSNLQGAKFAGYFELLTGKRRVVALADLGDRVGPDGSVSRRGAYTGIKADNTRYSDQVATIVSGKSVDRAGAAVDVSRKLTEEEARIAWDAERDAAPKTETHSESLLVGAILPVWDRVKGDPKVLRLQTDDGELLVGRRLRGKAAEETLKNLGVGSRVSTLTPAQIGAKIEQGSVALLANGWRLKKVRVSNENRVELLAQYLSPADQRILKEQGVFFERIAFQERAFLPVGDGGNPVLARLLVSKPVVEMLGGRPDGDVAAFSRGRVARPASLEKTAHVREIADAVLSAWPGAPKVVVASSLQDSNIPASVRRQDEARRSEGASGEINGFLLNDTVYLIANGLPTDADVVRVLAHEILGHVGLRGAFKGGLDRVLDQVVNLRRAEVTAKLRQYGLRDTLADRRVAAEEVLANMAEIQPQIGFVRRAVAAIRTWLRGLGLRLRLSDDEIITNFILPARAFIERGAKPVSGLESLRAAFALRAASGGFYSPLARAIESAPEKVFGSASGVKSWLTSNAAKLGVKKDELTWSGIEEWLDLQGKGKVSKADVVAFLDANGVTVEDVVLGGGGGEGTWNIFDEDGNEFGPFDTREEAEKFEVETRQEWEDERRVELNRKEQPGTKFSQYVPPGGIPGTYRETLVTLPVKSKMSEADALAQARKEFGIADGEVVPSDLTRQVARRVDELNPIAGGSSQFHSSHFDQPNILVHLRTDEVPGADGKRYMRVIEVQSDWGQEGKKQGFREAVPPANVEPVKFNEQTRRWDLTTEQEAEQWRAGALVWPTRQIAELNGVAAHKSINKPIPSAPFVTDTKAWASLGIKRAIMQAVDSGLDGIVFATGQQNADLYDLSKQVDRLWITPTGGVWAVTGYKNGNQILSKDARTESELAEFVGKEMAERAIADNGGEYSGLDLKVGGEGMRTFYDTIIPSVANDVLKKVGGGMVGRVDVDGVQAVGFQIADALRAKVEGDGLPLFARQDESGNTAEQRAFDETERAYGGKQAFERAKADGKTKLSYQQWVQVRTPAFKAWFGDWELAWQKLRPASTFTQAREAAKAFQGKPLTSRDGVSASVSRSNLDKMLSASVVHKSESAAEHAQAVANLDALFADAVTGWTKSDRAGDGNIASIRRMFAPMRVGNQARLVKLTIKEFAQGEQGNRIYSVESLEVGEVSPVPEMVDADRANGSRLLTGPTGLVESVVQRVRDFNPDTVSKVTDPDTGEPLVVYHGSKDGDGATVLKSRATNWGVKGRFFTTDQNVALDYANANAFAGGVADNGYTLKTDRMGHGVYAVFLNLRKPYAFDAQGQHWGDVVFPELVSRKVVDMGADGVVATNIQDGRFRNSNVANTWIAFRPTQIKSATGNSGAFDGKTPDIRFSRTAFNDTASVLRTRYGDLMQSNRTFNRWWHRTVGTQYHKAQTDTGFKRVFDAAQDYLGAVSSFANAAADEAKGLLPQLQSLRDVVRQRVSRKDWQAASQAVFHGTLIDQKVYSPGELRKTFGLTDVQIDIYRQFRAAVDKSLDDLTRADILRLAGKVGVDVRDAVLDAPTLSGAASILSGRLRAVGADSSANEVAQRVAKTEKLKAEGYAPLSRFGEYTVYVTRGDEQVYFGIFETQYEANRAARGLREDYPGANVDQGVLSGESYKLFSGMSMDTVELFADAVGVGQRALVQDYLRLAKSNRSAMKRLIRRKGIAGFNTDLPRVLASFITSNARLAASNVYGAQMTAAAEDIPKERGDVKDEAVRLVDYVQNPTEEAAKIRGLLFFQYIGGSVASAMVNLTQPVAMTLPYLTQFEGNAWRYLASGMKSAVSPGNLDAATKAALMRAERDGIVSPQELHQLQAQAMNKGAGLDALAKFFGASDTVADRVGDAGRKGLFIWGSLFSAAEQFNRRATFIAAFALARDKGLGDPFTFAEKAVVETQGVYNRGNRPNWARGAVGATLFTFKQYGISYLEFIKRLPRREQIMALAILVLAAGLNGIPFADDLDDLIDSLGQHLGYDTNAKAWKQKMAVSALGAGGAEFVLRGTSALPGVPIDFAGRLGMANLLPGTGFLRKDGKNKEGEILEVLGPAGGVVRDALKGEFAPLAVRNVRKALDMATFGMYRDSTGKRVIDTDGLDALSKGIGFQPSVVAREQRAIWTQTQRTNLVKNTESEIADTWAQGVFERDRERISGARELLARWNRNNPESPIAIKPQQIMQRVRQLGMLKRERVLKSAPKEIRGSVAAGL